MEKLKKNFGKTKVKKKTEELADKISFRLLATKNHPDYIWLCNELENSRPTFRSMLKNYWKLCVGGIDA